MTAIRPDVYASARIAVPPGFNIEVSNRDHAHFVVAAPRGIVPQPEAMAAAGAWALLLHYAGESWPNREEAARANGFLRCGFPVCFGFAALDDALGCYDRLVRERAQ